LRLELLYRIRFTYPEGWMVELDGGWEQHLYLAEGRCDGVISGRFRGANAPLRQGAAGPFRPDIREVIEADDGSTIMLGASRRRRQRRRWRHVRPGFFPINDAPQAPEITAAKPSSPLPTHTADLTTTTCCGHLSDNRGVPGSSPGLAIPRAEIPHRCGIL
jgi:hypothetical protein